MGIKSNFNKFLRETCPNVFETIDLYEYAYKRVAIDTSLYMHKFKAVCGDRWLSAFLNLVAALRKNDIHCVFVLDGQRPPEKDQERTDRRLQRERMNQAVSALEADLAVYLRTGKISKALRDLSVKRHSPDRLMQSARMKQKEAEHRIDMGWVQKHIKQKRAQLYNVCDDDFSLLQQLFSILCVPYCTAPTEAEKFAAKLCMDGKVDAVLSEDSDVIAYAAPVFLSKIDIVANTCVRLRHDRLLDALDLEPSSFLDFCILCGTDYNKNISLIGSKKAYALISTYRSIETLSAEKPTLDFSVLNHTRVRELFTVFSDYDMHAIPYCGRPNFSELDAFLELYNVRVDLSKLREHFEVARITIEDDTITAPKDDIDNVDDDTTTFVALDVVYPTSFEVIYTTDQNGNDEVEFERFTRDVVTGQKRMCSADVQPEGANYLTDMSVLPTKYNLVLVGALDEDENEGDVNVSPRFECVQVQVSDDESECKHTQTELFVYLTDLTYQTTNAVVLAIPRRKYKSPLILVLSKPGAVIEEYDIVPSMR